MKPLIYYGQNREDITLSAFFKDVKKGFYVDIGACDPVKFSVTKFFYDRGWRGINVEPQQSEYNKLAKDRKRDINLNIGIADKPGKLKLRAYDNEALSTFSEDIKGKYKQPNAQIGLEYKDKVIQVKTLKGIFDEHKVTSIQFLKVDVEGFEYKVLKGNDWNVYRPEVLCVEANNMVKTQPWQKLLKDAKYNKVFFDGLNEYYIAEEVVYRADQFRQEYQHLIVAVPLLFYDWQNAMDRTANQLIRVQTSLDHHLAANQNLQAQLETVNQKINNPIYLTKRLIRSVIKGH